MRVSVFIIFAFLFVNSSAWAEEQASRALLGEVPKHPFEVYVARSSVERNLGELIAATQDEFFKRYNELNVDDDYDVYCYRYPQSSYRSTMRFCGTSNLILSRGDVISAAAFIQRQESREDTHSKPVAGVSRPMAQHGFSEGNEYEVLRLKIGNFAALDEHLRELESLLLFFMAQRASQH